MKSPASYGQPIPVISDRSKPITPLVLKDILEREAYCKGNYGQALHSHDGRDNLVDAYQEALDLVLYLRKEIEEREIKLNGNV